MKKGHVAGKKIGGRHTTVNDVAQQVTQFAIKLAQVDRVITREIKHANGGQRRVACKPIQGGVEVICRQAGSVQKLVVITSYPGVVEQVITRHFGMEKSC